MTTHAQRMPVRRAPVAVVDLTAARPRAAEQGKAPARSGGAQAGGQGASGASDRGGGGDGRGGRADDDRGGFSAGEEEDRAEERERRWHVEHWRKLLKTGVCGA